jgi:hypothetical protein
MIIGSKSIAGLIQEDTKSPFEIMDLVYHKRAPDACSNHSPSRLRTLPIRRPVWDWGWRCAAAWQNHLADIYGLSDPTTARGS